ncbi:transcription termination/antitermination factor NusG [Blattabacterium sp. (Cryptocercus kyebangensis)]|uniref:transcription termination/antitermination protein NusG n=1 Tax=Blattabacterium sp. (Cryptocercus kyebangensis) TaxID=298656 RepID=UPI000D7C6E18|nr:transcription termination/antitermination protein NusG [Blattabacterium sp. (Cryptocercus kyebangensis)]AWU43621.1 transcription termination/antitermination factor NusG [Blattabacterium sp. (Cryptocercus kyebangensis)]
MSDLERKWYVLKTISGQENKVKLYIENEVINNGFKECIGKVLVPIEKVIQMRRGKKIHREKVHYPGYVMIETNLELEAVHAIKNVPGVINFLSEGRGGSAIPMRKEEVNKMLGKMDQLSESYENISIPFIIGETIKVIDGPFNGFNGTIEKINEEKRKLELAVLIFGRKTPLELNFTQIEKI